MKIHEVLVGHYYWCKCIDHDRCLADKITTETYSSNHAVDLRSFRASNKSFVSFIRSMKHLLADLYTKMSRLCFVLQNTRSMTSEALLIISVWCVLWDKWSLILWTFPASTSAWPSLPHPAPSDPPFLSTSLCPPTAFSCLAHQL